MPGLVDGLFAGRAGIQSHGIAISVLADNISNSNTVGFKAGRAEFTDLLAGNISGGGGGLQIGSGSNIAAVTQVFNQGSFEFTGRSLDAAIDGNGFFILQDNSGQRLYSRAGNFKVDSDGNILNQNGLSVLGFPRNGAGGLEALNVNDISQASVATQNITISGNLDAGAPAPTAPPAAPGDFQDLADVANFSTFVQVFDSLGGSHNATVYFFHTAEAPSTWTAQVYVDGGDVAGGTAGVPSLLGETTTLEFNASGQVAAGNTFTLNATNWANGGTTDAIDFSLNPITQFASNSTITSITQDGSGSGNVVSFNIEQDGTLFALLDNGQTTTIGTIALATFANQEGLRRQGDSLYAESNDSGEPVIGTPNTGRFGALAPEALELSTSDLASDFIKLISYQRGFQGSSRVITAIDDLYNELINLA